MENGSRVEGTFLIFAQKVFRGPAVVASEAESLIQFYESVATYKQQFLNTLSFEWLPMQQTK